MSHISTLLDALDHGLVVFKTSNGDVVAGHPTSSITPRDNAHTSDLTETCKVWTSSELATVRNDLAK